MFPEPLPFPRAPYADSLAVHAKLLANFGDRLFAEARAFGVEGSPFEHLHDYVGRIAPASMGVVVDMVPRRQAIELTRDLHGISRALYLIPPRFHFRLLIVARGLVSLHTLEIEGAQTDASRLRVVSRDDVVEPRKQKHRDAGAYTVTRWVAFDREPRYAWRLTPTEPTSWEESADRLLALYEGQVREHLQGYLAAGNSPAETLVQVSSSTRGDGIRAFDRPMHSLVTWFYPRIARAISEAERPDHVPLLLRGNDWGALRWIPVDAPDGGAPPPSIVEALTLPPDRGAPEPDEDEEADADEEAGADEEGAAPTEPPAPAAAKPKRRPTEVELVEVLFQMGIEDEVDRLTTLTSAEVDSEVASVGFDPDEERTFGPGLRQRVMEALVHKSLAAEGEP